MRAERQSLHLQKMMQKHKRCPEYQLILPAIALKRKKLHSLCRDDVLLLEMERLELLLMQDAQICAEVRLTLTGDTLRLKIERLHETALDQTDSKKYENILCTFGPVQSRVLEAGHIIEIPALNMQALTLATLTDEVAKGRLVTVDEKLAIQITEVNDG